MIEAACAGIIIFIVIVFFVDCSLLVSVNATADRLVFMAARAAADEQNAELASAAAHHIVSDFSTSMLKNVTITKLDYNQSQGYVNVQISGRVLLPAIPEFSLQASATEPIVASNQANTP